MADFWMDLSGEAQCAYTDTSAGDSTTIAGTPSAIDSNGEESCDDVLLPDASNRRQKYAIMSYVTFLPGAFESTNQTSFLTDVQSARHARSNVIEVSRFVAGALATTSRVSTKGKGRAMD